MYIVDDYCVVTTMYIVDDYCVVTTMYIVDDYCVVTTMYIVDDYSSDYHQLLGRIPMKYFLVHTLYNIIVFLRRFHTI
jgi:hypothetical protein